jgi:RNA polymerase sigma-70 factor (ECF subfamily)
MLMSVSQSRPQIGLALATTSTRECRLREIYELHHRWVYSTALRILGNPADAEDLTCEVFILAHRRISTFPEGSPFITWLHRLTVRAVLMYLRKMQFREDETEKTLPVINTNHKRRRPVSSPEEIALETAIAHLTPEDRMAIVLHDIEGYDHQEIARMLGISNQTCISQIHKARLSLRNLLSGSHVETMTASTSI